MLAWIVVLVVAIVLIAAAAGMYRQQQRRQLRARFGPEYSRIVKEYGEQRAEPVLVARQKRVAGLPIHRLPQSDAARFAASWRSIQAQFVDDPAGAITQADRLVTSVLQARGYPPGDFEQIAADVSVDHPVVVQNYRAAHETAVLRGRGQASTEDLRQAMVYYRNLFDELVENEQPTFRESQRVEVRR